MSLTTELKAPNHVDRHLRQLCPFSAVFIWTYHPSACLRSSPCTLELGLGAHITRQLSRPCTHGEKPWREPIWWLFFLQTLKWNNLKDVEFPILMVINDREMLLKETKEGSLRSASSGSGKRLLWAALRHGKDLGYSRPPWVFFAEDMITFQALVRERRLRPESHHCTAGSQDVSG